MPRNKRCHFCRFFVNLVYCDVFVLRSKRYLAFEITSTISRSLLNPRFYCIMYRLYGEFDGVDEYMLLQFVFIAAVLPSETLGLMDMCRSAQSFDCSAPDRLRSIECMYNTVDQVRSVFYRFLEGWGGTVCVAHAVPL